MAHSKTPHLRVALDLDGTLIDARARQVEITRKHMDSFGLFLDEGAFWRTKREGHSTRDALLALGHPHDIALEVAQRWAADIEKPEWLVYDRWLDGVVPLLERLSVLGFERRVLTARKDPEAALRQLERLRLTDKVSSVQVVDPAEAASAKAALLREGEFDLFVGDTESDAEAARLAGVPFVAVTTGLRSRGFLERLGLRVEDDLGRALAELMPLEPHTPTSLRST